VFLNAPFFNYGFYAVLFSKSVEANINNSLGTATEILVKDCFEKAGIKVLADKEYIIEKSLRDYLSHPSEGRKPAEGRQCDFIVETEDTIIFIELKRKTLIPSSRGGNIIKSVLDLTQSNFSALKQMGWHEIMLKHKGRIDFTDNSIKPPVKSSILLNGREVEKISLSLFDFHSLHDGALNREIINCSIGSEISSEDNSYSDDLNKINIELKELYFQYKKPEILKNNRFMNCLFLNIPQLLEILKHSNDNESFKAELLIPRNSSVNNGADWFFSYHYIRDLTRNP
jgi:hypothetical protein